MLRIKDVLLLLVVVGMLVGCGRHYSEDKIQEAPEINKEFYNNALAHLNESVENYPSNADNYYKKALVLMEFENYGSALLQAKKAVKLKRNDPEYLYLLAHLYAINDKTDLAIQTALAATRSGASRPKLNSLLAEMYLKSDSLELAFDHINKAIAESALKNAHHYYLKGKIYLALQDTALAEKNLLLSIADSTFHKEVYVTLSNLYFEKGKYIEANKYIDRILREVPSDKEILYEKGLILTEINLLDSAKDIFHDILRIDENYEEAITELSNIYFKQFNLDSASWYAEKALTLRPQYLDPMLIQARILDRKRQYFEAVQKYEAILAIDSTHTTARGELQYLRGKIAYFQRQREERRKREQQTLPTLEPVF